MRGVAHAFGDGGGEHHANGRVRMYRADEERRFREELAAAGEDDDVAQEAQAAGFAAILVVNFAVDFVGVGEVDKAGAGFKAAIGPAVEAKAGREGFVVEVGCGEVEKHELAAVETEVLSEVDGIESGAKGHELGFDAADARDGAQSLEHFGE